MKYDVQFKPAAVKDIRSMPVSTQSRILMRIEQMSNDLRGDVKRLTSFTQEYRLRVGNYRVLFEIEGRSIVIYRVRHRRDGIPLMEVAMSIPKAQIIKKNGKKEFAVLPYADFVRIQEDLEDYEDLRSLREAKESEKQSPTVKLSDLKRTLVRRRNHTGRRTKSRR
jgi:mRNA interferase RelE/StbE